MRKISKKKLDESDNKTPVVVGGPFNVQHKVHVDFEFAWSGQDPGEIFELVEKLGEGAFGAVYKAIHKASGFLLAIKVLAIGDPESEVNKDIRKEIDILRKCKSDHIVSYFGTVVQKSADGTHDLWILMDYCGKGSVRDSMVRLERTLTEREVAEVMRGTLLGLHYLHSLGITHRDVKAANILLNEKGQVKIADFGVSQQLTGTVGGGETLTGTPLWMAPEVVQRRTTPQLVHKSDIWSLGITAIECADGWPPHSDLKPMRAMVGIPVRPPPTLADPRKWSKEFNSFIASALIKDPAKRPSAAELLMHPFITRNMTTPEALKDLLSGSKGVWEVKFEELHALFREGGPMGQHVAAINLKIYYDHLLRKLPERKRFLPDFLRGQPQLTTTVERPNEPAPPARPKRSSSTCPSPLPTGDLGTAVVNDTTDVRTLATPQYLRNRKPLKASAGDDDEEDKNDDSPYHFADTVAVRTVVESAPVPTRPQPEPTDEGKRKKLDDSGQARTKRLAVYIPTFIVRSVNLLKGSSQDTPTTAITGQQPSPPSASAVGQKLPARPTPPLEEWRLERRLSRYLPNDRSVITYTVLVILALSLLLNVYLLATRNVGACAATSRQSDQVQALDQINRLVSFLTSSLGGRK